MKSSQGTQPGAQHNFEVARGNGGGVLCLSTFATLPPALRDLCGKLFERRLVEINVGFAKPAEWMFMCECRLGGVVERAVNGVDKPSSADMPSKLARPSTARGAILRR